MRASMAGTSSGRAARITRGPYRVRQTERFSAGMRRVHVEHRSRTHRSRTRRRTLRMAGWEAGAALNEAVARDLNEGIEAAHQAAGRRGFVPMLCECGM